MMLTCIFHRMAEEISKLGPFMEDQVIYSQRCNGVGLAGGRIPDLTLLCV